MKHEETNQHLEANRPSLHRYDKEYRENNQRIEREKEQKNSPQKMGQSRDFPPEVLDYQPDLASSKGGYVRDRIPQEGSKQRKATRKKN
jgi:hypothetical protein